jgi:hypothetical protein
MAVITSAAIAGTAITASTIAAGTAVAATAATTAMSFADAKKQRDLMRKAESEADAAMQEARKKLGVNVYDQLAINQDIYKQQRDQFSAVASEAIRAGVEGEQRGAGATAGRVLLASNQVQEGITSAMNQDLQQLEMLKAQEDARLRDIGVQLDLEEVAGAQLAAANAQELQAQSMQQGFAGVTSLGSQAAKQIPLFARSKGAEMSALGEMVDSFSGGNLNLKTFTPEQLANLEKVGGMNKQQYNQFLKTLKPEQRRELFTNQQFQNSYNSFSSNPFL